MATEDSDITIGPGKLLGLLLGGVVVLVMLCMMFVILGKLFWGDP